MGRENENKPFWKTLTDVSFYVKDMEKKWKERYNVYVYNSDIYPPNSTFKKRI